MAPATPPANGHHAIEAGRVIGRLRALPPEQARAVVLAVFGGCTADEISRREVSRSARRRRGSGRVCGGCGRRRGWPTRAQDHGTEGRSTVAEGRDARPDTTTASMTSSRSCSARSRDGSAPRWPRTCSAARPAGASTTRSRRGQRLLPSGAGGAAPARVRRAGARAAPARDAAAPARRWRVARGGRGDARARRSPRPSGWWASVPTTAPARVAAADAPDGGDGGTVSVATSTGTR